MTDPYKALTDALEAGADNAWDTHPRDTNKHSENRQLAEACDAATIRALLAERDALRRSTEIGQIACLADIREAIGDKGRMMQDELVAHIRGMKAELDALREDADRYRWLRDGCNDKGSEATRIAAKCWGLEWDAAIDAALSGPTTNEGA